MLSSGQSQRRAEPRTLRPGSACGWGRGSFGEGIPSSFSPGPKGTSRRMASVAGRSSTCLGNCPFPSIWRREGCFSQKYKSAPRRALGLRMVVRVGAAHSLVSGVDLTASQRSLAGPGRARPTGPSQVLSPGDFYINRATGVAAAPDPA